MPGTPSTPSNLAKNFTSNQKNGSESGKMLRVLHSSLCSHKLSEGQTPSCPFLSFGVLTSSFSSVFRTPHSFAQLPPRSPLPSRLCRACRSSHSFHSEIRNYSSFAPLLAEAFGGTGSVVSSSLPTL